MFAPVTRPEQLPVVGSTYEKLTLDLKAGPGAYRKTVAGASEWSTFEMAKDVAAFGNGNGGTILVGAVENAAAGVCESIAPITAAAVNDFTIEFTKAVEKRCRPRPLFEIDRVEVAGGVVVAVNVFAFPGQPIAVVVNASKPEYGGDSYVFPVRLVAKTVYLSPEQLPMFMSADVRRRAIILAACVTGEEITVHPAMMIENDAFTRPFPVRFLALDELANVVIVVNGDREVGLPLDGVSAAWRDRRGTHIVTDRRLFG